MKNLRFMLLACLAIAATSFFISCQSGAKGDARASVTGSNDVVNPTSDATSPANNSANTNPANQASAIPSGPTTTMTFSESSYDYGTVDQGEKVEHVYKFTNSGSEPLIISNAKGSCGCTVPSWPKEPIAPGEESEILVQFDSKGKKGNQTKTVTITANTTPPQSTLRITGVVNAPEVEAKPVQ